MNSEELQKLAQHSRHMREAGITLLLASGILALFLLVPLFKQESPAIAGDATPAGPDAFANVPLNAKAAIVYDLVEKRVLYAKNADAQLPLASLTKLLTVYSAVSELPSDTLVTIGKGATQLDPPRAFNEGQTFELADLARLTLTASLNDGAAAIIETTASRAGRSQTEALAGAAAALDLSQTFAINGSGLDMNALISGAYGSARDLAVLAGALVAKAPSIVAATTQKFAEAVSLGGTAFKVLNTDPIVDAIPNILLSKTGYTDLAGGNLAIVFDVGIGHPVAVVVLGSSKEERFTDGSALVAATLAHFAGVESL